MTLHLTALFAHILGVAFLFMALGIELMANLARRRARNTEQVVAISSIERLNPIAHLTAIVLILGGGVYMAHTLGLFSQAWVVLALIFTVLLAALGITLGNTRHAQMVKLATTATSSRITPALWAKITDPVMAVWNVTGVVMTFWIIYLMTNKPDLTGSLISLGLALVIGFALSIPLLRGAAVPTKAVAVATASRKQ